MFDFRFVILGFGFANSLCSTYFGEISKGNLLMFVVTFLLAFPFSLLIAKIMTIAESRGKDVKDVFDALPEGSGVILRNIIADSIILLMVTCSVIALYTGSRSIFSDTFMLSVIGSISIILACLYQFLFYKLGKDSFSL